MIATIFLFVKDKPEYSGRNGGLTKGHRQNILILKMVIIINERGFRVRTVPMAT